MEQVYDDIMTQGKEETHWAARSFVRACAFTQSLIGDQHV